MADPSEPADPHFDVVAFWRIVARKRLDPRDLPARIGCTPHTFGYWAAGIQEPRPMALENIARALGVKRHELLTKEPQ
jgi:hypothetical protein